MQSTDAKLNANFPGVQAEQMEIGPPLETYPAAHNAHSADPEELANLPAGQFMQSPLPLNIPGAQFLQDSDPAMPLWDVRPAGQLKHKLAGFCPANSEYIPLAHSSHLLNDVDDFPSGHGMQGALDRSFTPYVLVCDKELKFFCSTAKLVLLRYWPTEHETAVLRLH
jgi:hypothetical protein